MNFFVLGLPKPQARPRAFKRGKHASVYSPSTEWKESVKYAAAQQEPIQAEALEVHLNFYFDRPDSHYGTGRNSDKLKPSAPEYHTKRPDVDNLAKAVLDACQDAGLFKDDSAIVGLTIEKFYLSRDDEVRQGCEISIEAYS
jgi:Holliday junction resolvase RusA-like endonuclease